MAEPTPPAVCTSEPPPIPCPGEEKAKQQHRPEQTRASGLDLGDLLLLCVVVLLLIDSEEEDFLPLLVMAAVLLLQQ